jgi:hypothetical protein
VAVTGHLLAHPEFREDIEDLVGDPVVELYSSDCECLRVPAPEIGFSPGLPVPKKALELQWAPIGRVANLSH